MATRVMTSVPIAPRTDARSLTLDDSTTASLELLALSLLPHTCFAPSRAPLLNGDWLLPTRLLRLFRSFRSAKRGDSGACDLDSASSTPPSHCIQDVLLGALRYPPPPAPRSRTLSNNTHSSGFRSQTCSRRPSLAQPDTES